MVGHSLNLINPLYLNTVRRTPCCQGWFFDFVLFALISQVITLDIEGRKASIDSLNETVEQRRRDSSVQKYHDKLAKINRAFAEVQFKAGRRKDDIVAVYQKIVVQFEEWLVKIRKRLDSGELLTTDILQFEENLTVSNPTLIFISFRHLIE